MSHPDALSSLAVDPWPEMDLWRIGGGTGRWIAVRPHGDDEIRLIATSLEGLIASCRYVDRRATEDEP